MNDYLGRLVLRARGELEAPRPLIGPLFAPETAAGEPEGEIVESPPRSPAPNRQSIRPVEPPRSVTADDPRRSGPLAVPSSLQRSEERKLDRAGQERASLSSVAQSDSVVEGIYARVRTPPRVDMGETIAQGEEEQTTTVPRNRPHVMARPVGAAQTAETSAGRRRNAEETGAASTIHISIGRVEVRAVMPIASKTATPPPQPPPLSLGEYLKARGEKRRG
jgi:hypothetical protein